VRPRREQALKNNQRFSQKVHFGKRLSRQNQRVSVTDLMALGKLHLDGNQDEGHELPRQAGAMDSQPSASRTHTHPGLSVWSSFMVGQMVNSSCSDK